MIDMIIDAKHYGFKSNYTVALYYKAGEWRIYEEASYTSTKGLIEEVMCTKRVKRDKVKLAKVKSLNLEVI